MTYRIMQALSTIHMRIEAILRDEEGQGLTEYALIIAFVSIVAIVALKLLGTNITSVLNEAAKEI
jgi:Flp pilus assembly pilin Flp